MYINREELGSYSSLRGPTSSYHTRQILLTVQFQADTASPTVPLPGSQSPRGMFTMLYNACDHPEKDSVIYNIALEKLRSTLTIWDIYWTVVQDFSVIATANSNATTSAAMMLTTTHNTGLITSQVIRYNSMTHDQIPLSA